MRWGVAALLVVLMVSGCAAPRYSGTASEPSVTRVTKEVVVIRDDATKRGFLEAIEHWLAEHQYDYTVAPDGSKHDLDKLTIEYVGYWKWDLAIYLSRAEIEMFHGGQRVGRVNYRAPNTLNTNKFGTGSDRVAYMMDVLFGKMTPEEATEVVNAPEDEELGR
ncbi:hypothetical protein H0Z60_08570 [Ectothiorhodospiraceae bacterium WFHF3C12]|nr:hypothetical protein [Ectothiorhodospiraceae bacterium WFHF3C12]